MGEIHQTGRSRANAADQNTMGNNRWDCCSLTTHLSRPKDESCFRNDSAVHENIKSLPGVSRTRCDVRLLHVSHLSLFDFGVTRTQSVLMCVWSRVCSVLPLCQQDAAFNKTSRSLQDLQQKDLGVKPEFRSVQHVAAVEPFKKLSGWIRLDASYVYVPLSLTALWWLL